MLDRNLSSVFHLVSRRSPRGGYSWLSFIDWGAGSERLITIPKHRQGQRGRAELPAQGWLPAEPWSWPSAPLQSHSRKLETRSEREADLAGWLECFGLQQMCRGPKTDLSRTSGNEVLTFSSHSDRQCEGTGVSALGGQALCFWSHRRVLFSFSCSLCPAFLWCFVPGAWEGSTWQPFQRRAPGSFAESQRLARG